MRPRSRRTGPLGHGATASRALTVQNASRTEAASRVAGIRAGRPRRAPLVDLDDNGGVVRTTSSSEGAAQPVARLKALAWRDANQRLVFADTPFWFFKLKGPAARYALGDGLRPRGLTDRFRESTRPSARDLSGLRGMSLPAVPVRRSRPFVCLRESSALLIVGRHRRCVVPLALRHSQSSSASLNGPSWRRATRWCPTECRRRRPIPASCPGTCSRRCQWLQLRYPIHVLEHERRPAVVVRRSSSGTQLRVLHTDVSSQPRTE